MRPPPPPVTRSPPQPEWTKATSSSGTRHDIGFNKRRVESLIGYAVSVENNRSLLSQTGSAKLRWQFPKMRRPRKAADQRDSSCHCDLRGTCNLKRVSLSEPTRQARAIITKPGRRKEARPLFLCPRSGPGRWALRARPALFKESIGHGWPGGVAGRSGRDAGVLANRGADGHHLKSAGADL
jgi:hypothetical protein